RRLRPTASEERRALRDRIVRGAIVLDIARTKFQVLPRAAVEHREAGVDLAPGLLVDDVDVLSAEDPAEAQRRRIAGRERHGVVGRAEIEVRPAANTVHLPSRAVTDARGGLGQDRKSVVE